MKKQKFQIIYDKEIKEHLKVIESKFYSLIRQKIEEQLLFEPTIETNDRKPLNKFSIIGEHLWELRFGPDNSLRVFYKTDIENFQVNILAIGIKKGNQLKIGKEEF